MSARSRRFVSSNKEEESVNKDEPKRTRTRKTREKPNTTLSSTNSMEQPSNTEKKEENKKEQTEESQCGICLDPPKIRGSLDSCAHIFCFECIHQWSKTSNTCPFCKQRFKQISKMDPSLKKPKKVKVRHADQHPQYEAPNWLSFASESDDEEFNPFHFLPFAFRFFFDEDDEDNALDYYDEEEIDFDGFDDGYGPLDVIDLTLDSDYSSDHSPSGFTTAHSLLSTQPPPFEPQNNSSTNRRSSRRSVREVSHPPPVTQQRTRTSTRRSNGRQNVVQNRRNGNSSQGRSYRNS